MMCDNMKRYNITLTFQILLCYGVTHILAVIFRIFNQFVFQKPMWNFYTNTMFDFIFLIYFWKKFAQQRSEKIYVYDWGILASLLPFINCLLRVIIYLINSAKAVERFGILAENELIIENVLLCWAGISTALIIRKKWLIFPVIAFFVVILILNTVVSVG